MCMTLQWNIKEQKKVSNRKVNEVKCYFLLFVCVGKHIIKSVISFLGLLYFTGTILKIKIKSF
jgi:hypothetical protein